MQLMWLVLRLGRLQNPWWRLQSWLWTNFENLLACYRSVLVLCAGIVTELLNTEWMFEYVFSFSNVCWTFTPCICRIIWQKRTERKNYLQLLLELISHSHLYLWCNFGLQVCTQRSWKRPYGVGLLVAGLDESGAHLYYNCPSGNYFEYQAFAIGSRSQAAKTYLERKFENFVGSSLEDLIKDALIATRESLQA